MSRAHWESVNTLALLPNGVLASGSEDKTIILWKDLDCKRRLRLLLLILQRRRVPLFAQNRRNIFRYHQTWDSLECVGKLEGHTDQVLCLAVLPDGSLASGSRDGTVKLWNKQGRRLHSHPRRTYYACALLGCLIP